jgi:hypothetical protein
MLHFPASSAHSIAAILTSTPTACPRGPLLARISCNSPDSSATSAFRCGDEARNFMIDVNTSWTLTPSADCGETRVALVHRNYSGFTVHLRITNGVRRCKD